MTNTTPICVRVPITMLKAIDQLVREKRGKSRSAVILTSIEASLLDRKLKRSAWIQIRKEQRSYTQRRTQRG